MKKSVVAIIMSILFFVVGFYAAMKTAIPNRLEDGSYEINFCGFVFLYE